MPHFCASFLHSSFHFPILLLISLQIFAFTLAIHPLKVRRDEQRQQQGLTNEDLTEELANLERQIVKINSTISAFFAQQQQREREGQGQSNDGGEKIKEMEMNSAKLMRLQMEKGMLEKMMEDASNNGTKEASKESNNNETTNPEIKKANSNSSSTPMVSDASRLLCQFFVFGILFGVVCSISACSCLFRSRRNAIASSTRNCSQSVEEANFNRLSQIREPFAPDKPYCLKFDERGLCYASPLTREVPPLPNYEQACRMPTAEEIAAIGNKAAITAAMATNLQGAMTVRKALDSIDALRV